MFLFFVFQSDFKHPYFIHVSEQLCVYVFLIFKYGTFCFCCCFFDVLNHLHLRSIEWVCGRWCIFITKYDGKIAMWMVLHIDDDDVCWHILTWCRDWHLPYTDGVVTVAGEQGLAIGWPGKWQTLWWIGLWVWRNDIGAKLFDSFLACQVL